MDDNIKIPSSNVLPFLAQDRKKGHGDVGNAAADSCDHGPSPEESLRIMRAFVGIKNRKLRENLIDMLESALRGPVQTPEPAEK
jgi:hypothetical protein